MATQNGNLTTGERRTLPSGAVVAWQGSRMLSEQTGTIDTVSASGRLALCDGSIVCQDDFCRLVSAKPTQITMPDVRGLDDDPPEAPAKTRQTPQDAPKAVEPVTAPAVSPQPVEAKETAAAALPRAGAGRLRKRADHELWLAAVRLVQECMGTGMARPAAVAHVKADPRFAALGLTVDTFAWWRRQFVTAGKMERPGKSQPTKRPSPIGQKVPAGSLAVRQKKPAATSTLVETGPAEASTTNANPPPSQATTSAPSNQPDHSVCIDAASKMARQIEALKGEIALARDARPVEAQAITVTITITGLGEVLSRIAAGLR